MEYTADITLTTTAYPKSPDDASPAFDNNISSGAQISSFALGIGQDFGSQGKKIRKIRFYRGTFGTMGSVGGKVQYSNDAINWYDTNINSIDFRYNSGVQNTWQEFLVNDYDFHRFWQIKNIGDSYTQTTEVEMMEELPSTSNLLFATGL